MHDALCLQGQGRTKRWHRDASSNCRFSRLPTRHPLPMVQGDRPAGSQTGPSNSHCNALQQHLRLTNVPPAGGWCATCCSCCSCCAEAVCASCARLSSISARRLFVILRCQVSKSSPGAGDGMRAGTHGRYTAARGGAGRAAVLVVATKGSRGAPPTCSTVRLNSKPAGCWLQAESTGTPEATASSAVPTQPCADTAELLSQSLLKPTLLSQHWAPDEAAEPTL